MKRICILLVMAGLAVLGAWAQTVTGSGSTKTIPKSTGPSTIGDSQIQIDDNFGINTDYIVGRLSVFESRDIANPTVTTAAPAASLSFNFTAINFPGATRTRANGLSNSGDIVGDYLDSSGVRHGYLLHQGNFTSFDAPGSIMTRGLAVNNLGVIGGRFVDSNNVSRSFLLDHGAFTIFDFPGATATFLQGLNDRGQAVGAYNDSAGNQHGFVLSAGTFATIDFPSAVDFTFPTGITNNGEIVGGYDDSNGTFHGFILIASNFSTVDYPGAFLTQAFRANDAGQIVGVFNLAGQHGFLATPIPIQKP